MKNKFLLPLLLLTTPLTAQVTVTPNIGLQIPYYGQTNWQVPIQYDLNQLDLLLSGNSPLPGINTWSATYTYPIGGIATYGGAPYVSLQAANINHNPSSATTWWFKFPLTASAFSIVPGTNITCTPLVSGSCTGSAVTINAASTLSTPFSSLSSSTNISAAMVVGSGASLAPSGTGTITATSMPYSGLTGTVTTWNQSTTGTAANLTAAAVLPSGTTISGLALTATTFNFGYVGVPGVNQSLGYIAQAGTTVTVPINCTGSYAFGSTASSTTDVFTITNCTSGSSSCSAVGTVTFTSSATGVYSCSGSFTVAPGGSLTITGPATATITNPSFVVYGVHN